MTKPMNVQQFFKMFSSDDACLEHLFKTRHGDNAQCTKCGAVGKFRRLSKIPAYSCMCGNHIHPMVGTPFENSRTPLQKWFYAMYLFTTSRHGVPAKELQRQLAVTYKCAWRMGHEIRKYMGAVDGNTPLSGDVEVDETFIGGVVKGGQGGKGKTVVFGMLGRNGDVMTKVVPNRKVETLYPIIVENIERGSTILTDDYSGYKSLGTSGFKHESVNHSAKEYARGKCHTNTIEGFWSRLKLSIRGTHVHVSSQHLPKYLGEFEYRYNMRKCPELMFDRLLMAF